MTEKKYSLKSNAMHRWLYSRKVDPVIVADRLRMRVSVFKRMIKDKTPFEEEQIRRLVYFMGAKKIYRQPMNAASTRRKSLTTSRKKQYRTNTY